MVGDPDSTVSLEPEVPKSSVPRVKTFSCSSCGASVTVRNPGCSMSAVCDSCHSIIDITDDNFRILTRYFSKKNRRKPRIELGTRGTLKGKTVGISWLHGAKG